MSKAGKTAIVVVLLAGISAVLVAKRPSPAPLAGPQADETDAPRPTLLELGSTTCIPCKMMEPILAELRAEYAGRLRVEFIDVHKDKAAGEKHDVWVLPTQVLLDASGKELFRHEGFYPKDEILAKWKELGVDLGPPASGPASGGSAGGPRPVLERVFASLGRAVGGTPLLALAAALAWGVLSVLLSPCHLSSIPLIVGFINGQGRMSARRACLLATLFSVGILITIGAIGAITAAAGRLAGGLGSWVSYAVAGILFLVGLHLLDVLPMPWSAPGQVGMKRKGMLAAFVLGLVFGIALGPCTFAYMAPMLAVTFKLAATSALYGALLLAVYGIGHCSVIVLAGTSTEWVQRYLNWNERSRGPRVAKWICGVLVLLSGAYLIYIS